MTLSSRFERSVLAELARERGDAAPAGRRQRRAARARQLLAAALAVDGRRSWRRPRRTDVTSTALPNEHGQTASGAVVGCSECGLMIASRTTALAPRYCPRCLAHRQRAIALQAIPSRAPVISLELPHTNQAPALARRWLADSFAAELDDRELDRAKLLVSELVTNAVVHGHGRVELHGQLDHDRLRVEVTDEGAGFTKTAREHRLDTVGGYGLPIVDAEASHWGIREEASEVWFELQRR